jgi:DNA primase
LKIWLQAIKTHGNGTTAYHWRELRTPRYLFFLNKQKTVNELVLCLDNDTAGRKAAAVMAREYTDRSYITSIELPNGKDFNEDLTALIQKNPLEKTQKHIITSERR